MKNSPPQTAAQHAPETQDRPALDPAQLKVLDGEPAVDELGEEEDESAPKYKNMEENQTQRCDDVVDTSGGYFSLAAHGAAQRATGTRAWPLSPEELPLQQS